MSRLGANAPKYLFMEKLNLREFLSGDFLKVIKSVQELLFKPFMGLSGHENKVPRDSQTRDLLVRDILLGGTF